MSYHSIALMLYESCARVEDSGMNNQMNRMNHIFYEKMNYKSKFTDVAMTSIFEYFALIYPMSFVLNNLDLRIDAYENLLK